MRVSVSEPYSGVTRAMPASRSRAASSSASRGAIELEDLLEDLGDRAQRVELAALDLLQHPAQLGIVRDDPLEVLLRSGGRDREDLACQMLAAALLEPAVLREVGAVLLDLRPELVGALSACGLREHDRRAPVALLAEREHRAHLVQH